MNYISRSYTEPNMDNSASDSDERQMRLDHNKSPMVKGKKENWEGLHSRFAVTYRV